VNERPADLIRLISELEAWAPSPQNGLPEPVFLLVSRLTPLLSVDLLIRDEMHRTLLTWRDDASYGPGWHVPGGIVRYRERVETRIQEVARLELGARVEYEPAPHLVHECLRPKTKDRAHTVSLMYRCRLLSRLDERFRFDPKAPKAGCWQWHSSCPGNLIQDQRVYERYFS
jgi:colanic acid biosynthesis protein WcaH